MSIEDKEHTYNDKVVKPTHKLVIVEWLDSQSSAGWRHEKDVNPNYHLPVVYTTGYLIEDKPEYVTISSSMIFYEEVSNQVCGLMTIPRGCITSVTILKKAKVHVRAD